MEFFDWPHETMYRLESWGVYCDEPYICMYGAYLDTGNFTCILDSRIFTNTH